MHKKTRVLVTGASGFIGHAIMNRLSDDEFLPIAAIRRKSSSTPMQWHSVEVGDLGRNTCWLEVLQGVECIVHTAGRAHVMKDIAVNPLAEFRRINVTGTIRLAEQAALAGVKRIIFISSIKVNGEKTNLGVPYTEDDAPRPLDSYGISKLEAEQALLQVGKKTGIEIVIIRPPLVYGPGVKANFLRMVRWLSRSFPLPLGSVDNRRSLVALGNLTDLIVRCIHHPNAANNIFLVSDGEDLSTASLLYRIGIALGKPVRLIPVPVGCLIFFAKIFGYELMVDRLCSSLQVDISKARQILGWAPPIGIDEGLAEVVRDLRK
jgi:UDP-glucose 4-epimerase